MVVAGSQKMVSPITDVVIPREKACLLGILDFDLCLDDTVRHIPHDAYSLYPNLRLSLYAKGYVRPLVFPPNLEG